MTPEHWQRVKEVLNAALGRDPHERAAFLSQACGGDESLRHEVESLIISHGEAGSFIEEPAFNVNAEMFADEQTESLAGRSFGPYEILSQLGAGGMGDVYLAQDGRLGRQVALKLLPSQFTSDADRLLRFQQEARAASALNHPNILTIHEIGQIDGHPFIATEFIDGVTLRERLTSTSMKLSEALEIAVQVAAALTAAHAANIVHRDIKPENIMIRDDGYVKVLDFGLAKLTDRPASTIDSEAATRALVKTNPGMVMGTVQYMSPEQARGLPVDERTDLWSLGVVLYEMAAGCVPFEGETTTDVILSVVEKEPPPLARYSREIPVELERIVNKALRKNRDERYRTVKDLALDLKSLKQELEKFGVPSSSGWLTDPKTTQPEGATLNTLPDTPITHPRSGAEYIVSEIKSHKRRVLLALATLVITIAAVAYFLYLPEGSEVIDSIAVMPFVNVNANPDMEYLSDGITESLINSLSQVPRLRMIARSSVFRYKGKEIDPQTVGRELGVRAILLGRVTQRGDNLSISAELVDARNNSRIWGKQYSRKLSDVLQMQAEISREISDKLRLKLSGEEQKLVAKRYTENVEAYQLYLKGHFYLNKRNEESLKRGIDYFQQAIATDPHYALAYSGLADSYSTLGSVFVSAMLPREAMVNMKSVAQKALELDDTLAEAHTSLADAKFRGDWDWSGAEREFKRALELNPNYAEGHQLYAQYLVAMGRFEESIAEGKRAQALDPVSPRASSQLGFNYYCARQYDHAIEECRQALDLDPNFLFAHWVLGLAYANKSMYEQAIAESRKAIEVSGHGPGAVGVLGYVYGASGRRDEAQQVLDELKELAKRRYVSPFSVAAIYARLGDKDAAFEWLEKAYLDGAYGMLFLKVAPEWDGFRSEPRFQDVMRRVGLPQ